MSQVRQYIGARYVTKIYENSLDPSSAEWESGVTYEPLTMVTYLNSSYLSKKDVPGSVGNPADNPSYWVVTGAYNGQIASLQNQIDTINNVIGDSDSGLVHDVSAIEDTLNIENIILMGDSYGVDGEQWSGGTAWTSYIHTLYPNSVNLATGRAGFATSENPFLTLLTNADLPDKDKYTQILLMAGANDAIGLHSGAITDEGLRSAIGTFISYAKTNYPNAVIKIAFIGNHQNIAEDKFDMARKAYKEESFNNGALYFSDGERILENKNLSSDTLHPTQEASYMFGEFGVCCLNNMPYDIDYIVTDSLDWADDTYATSGAHIDVKFSKDGAHIILKGSALSTNTWLQIRKNDAVTLSDGNVEICTLNAAPVTAKYLNTPVVLFNGVETEMGTLIYHDSTLYVRALNTMSANVSVVISACDLFVPYN